MIRVVIPGVPRGKGRPRSRIVRAKDGRQFVGTYTPAETRSEEGAVRMFAQAAMQGAPPIEGPLDIRIAAYMPVPASWSARKIAQALDGSMLPTGRPDIDNICKLVMDGLIAIMLRDDSQVVTFSAWKRYSANPRVVVELRRIVQDGTETR